MDSLLRTYQEATAVKDNHRGPETVFVAEPGSPDQDGCVEDIRRRGKTQRRRKVKSHPVAENNGEKVCNGIGYCRDEPEERRESPNLQIGAGAEVVAELELFGVDVVAILLQSRNHNVDLMLAQERKDGAIDSSLGEVHDEHV